MNYMSEVHYNEVDRDITESTEKLDKFEISGFFEIILAIVKVHTELTVGE